MKHITVMLGIDTATVSPEPSPEAYAALVEKQVTKKLSRQFPNIKFDFDWTMDDNAETEIRFGGINLTEREREQITDTIQSAESDAISDPAVYGMG